MLTQPFSTQSASYSQKGLLAEPRDFKQDGKEDDEIAQHYVVFKSLSGALLKNQYLHELLNEKEVIFYKFFQQHLKEVLPILYTPTVGEVVQAFHSMRNYTRGLYISWPQRDRIKMLLEPYQDVISIAILTDGERILGLGDQGVGGIEICIAKAMLYVVCARLMPTSLLPIYLDVGTNNPQLLEDPNYKGWRHTRLSQKDYDDFLDEVVTELRKKFPNIYLHWEDLKQNNANRLLERYQGEFCTFNDDIQGTGVVTLASALTAMKITGTSLLEQRIVIFGGGTAGLGIANQLCSAMQRMGLTFLQAREKIWLIGRYGLLFENSDSLTSLQKPYARPSKERFYYEKLKESSEVNLISVIKYVKPTFLIGCSGKKDAFTQEVITEMAQHVIRPIVFPLSNPTTCSEAVPQDILDWTQNKALIATGSPFEDAIVNQNKWPISQCNNALAFPGIALGIKASYALSLTEDMLWAASLALCEATPSCKEYPILLPDMSHIHSVSEKIADAIYQVVQKKEGLDVALQVSDRIKSIRSQYWEPLC